MTLFRLDRHFFSFLYLLFECRVSFRTVYHRSIIRFSSLMTQLVKYQYDSGYSRGAFEGSLCGPSVRIHSSPYLSPSSVISSHKWRKSSTVDREKRIHRPQLRCRALCPCIPYRYITRFPIEFLFGSTLCIFFSLHFSTRLKIDSIKTTKDHVTVTSLTEFTRSGS